MPFVRLQECGRVVFSAAIDGAVYAKHGTSVDTRLLVIDKQPADDQTVFPTSPGVAPDVATLLAWVTERVPPRLPFAPPVAAPRRHVSSHSTNRPCLCHAPIFRYVPARTARRRTGLRDRGLDAAGGCPAHRCAV